MKLKLKVTSKNEYMTPDNDVAHTVILEIIDSANFLGKDKVTGTLVLNTRSKDTASQFATGRYHNIEVDVVPLYPN